MFLKFVERQRSGYPGSRFRSDYAGRFPELTPLAVLYILIVKIEAGVMAISPLTCRLSIVSFALPSRAFFRRRSCKRG
jgi:hypothetical protein